MNFVRDWKLQRQPTRKFMNLCAMID